MHHALSIRIVALAVMILSVGVGATSYLGSRGKTEDRSAVMHVQAAVNATRAWYQDPYGGHGSYRTLSSAGLVHEAPAVSSKVAVTVLHGGRAYCISDVEAPGHSAYYLGGNTAALTHLAGAVPWRVTLVHSTGADAAALCTAVR
jgi:type II secretory pathway pseudopilin PulG